MALEIRELIIKATVDNDGAAQGSTSEGNADDSMESQAYQQETIVNLCVEKVLEILKEKSER